MKKFVKIGGDVVVTVGCCVGVGMLSGKESQIFVGNYLNAVIFAVIFGLTNVVIRLFCLTTRSTTLNDVSRRCFGKGATICDIALSTCCFVCITTLLAGVQDCLSTILPVGEVLPLYAILAAVISALILHKGMSSLKFANFVALALAVGLIATLFCAKEESNAVTDVPVTMPAVYALFSTTMSLGVTARLANEKSVAENVISAAVSSVVLAVIAILILPCCNFDRQLPSLGEMNAILKCFTVITLLLSSVTGLAANAYPIAEGLADVIPDKTLRCAAIFSFALAFSTFGFDFAVKFGYVLVSVAGTVIVVTGGIKTVRLTRAGNKRRHIKPNVKSACCKERQ